MRKLHVQTISLAFAASLAWGSFSIAHAQWNEGDPATARARTALRERPGADYRVVTRIHPGDPLVVERTKGDWVRVKAGSYVGWAPMALIKPGEPAPASSAAPSPRTHHRRTSPEGKARAPFVTDGKFTSAANAPAAAARVEPTATPRGVPSSGAAPAAGDSK